LVNVESVRFDRSSVEKVRRGARLARPPHHELRLGLAGGGPGARTRGAARPNDPKGHRYDEAVAALKEAEDLDATLSASHEWLGQTYGAMGRYAEAAAGLESAWA
jgi:hypothetical protein